MLSLKDIICFGATSYLERANELYGQWTGVLLNHCTLAKAT
jgi:hypothetical protein